MITRCIFFTMFSCLAAMSSVTRAQDCDPLLSELLKQAAAPAVRDIGCFNATNIRIPPFGPTIRIAIDQPYHYIEQLCYIPRSDQSILRTTIQLRCRTSRSAFIEASISERVHLSMTIRNDDCEIIDYRLTTSGEIGKLVTSAADFFDLVRPPLQSTLDRACK